MRFSKIHLCGVHRGPSKMYRLLLMCMRSSAAAERRGWRESGSFSPCLPALGGGSGSAKDWKSEECPGDRVWNSEISGTLEAGCLQVSLQVSMVPCPCSPLPTAGAHWSLTQSQNKESRRKLPSLWEEGALGLNSGRFFVYRLWELE